MDFEFRRAGSERSPASSPAAQSWHSVELLWVVISFSLKWGEQYLSCGVLRIKQGDVCKVAGLVLGIEHSAHGGPFLSALCSLLNN